MKINKKKLFLLLVKFMPVIQLIATLLNNTLYCFDIYKEFAFCIDFTFGNSLMFILYCYVASKALNFCKWHKLLILCNLTNLSIAFIDSIFTINISDLSLLMLYYIVTVIFIIIIVRQHTNICKNETAA